MTDATSLRGSNLLYREPDVYDAQLVDDPTPDVVVDLAHASGTAPRPEALDLGCGTGRLLRRLHAEHAWHGTGVDLQPHLIDHARAHADTLAWHVGDIRTIRLEQRFDVLLCVGNTLAYLHEPDDLDAALRTARDHSRPGTLLVLATIDTVPESGEPTPPASVVTPRGTATVQSTTSTIGNARIVTDRTWTFPDGRVEHDHVVRRVWTRDDLTTRVRRHGFEPIEHQDDPLPVLAALAARDVASDGCTEHADR